MSEITKRPSLKAINVIRKKFISTLKKLINPLDREELYIPLNIGELSRLTRYWEHITDRDNQPYFEQDILKPLEDEGCCVINHAKRVVIFLKLPK